jgi:RNA polymerase sigma-70 factor, ECF subfamily
MSFGTLEAPPSSTEELMERLARREPAAVGEVYDLHHQAVRAFARRLVGDAMSAEDLVHDVFVALPDAIKSYGGRGALRTFIMGIAVNHARHHVRSAARRRAAMSRFGEEPISREPTDPEQDLRRRQLAAALTRALDALPLDQRVAFVLCELEERTSQDAAKIAGAPEGTIRTRLHHAKRKLREALAKEQIR